MAASVPSVSTLTVQAPAKVNLALSVGPPDAQGMHPICSWMTTVDLCDELELTRLGPGSPSRYAMLWHQEAPAPSDIDWSLRSDLAVRAHLALEGHLGRALPVQLALRKRIPIGGGLGGGSSNAAAMLRACAQLFDLHDDVTAEDLGCLAQTLGSDVPFLVHGGTAVVEGLGERLTPAAAPPGCLVLVMSDTRCDTGRVYGRYDQAGPVALRPDAVQAAVEGNGPCFNDLAQAAMDESTVLRTLAKAVQEISQRDVHVSGSGSTLFVRCDARLEAKTLTERLIDQLDVAAVVAQPCPSSVIQAGTASATRSPDA